MTAVMTTSELERKGRAQRPEQGWSIPEPWDRLWMPAHTSRTNMMSGTGQSTLGHCCTRGLGTPKRRVISPHGIYPMGKPWDGDRGVGKQTRCSQCLHGARQDDLRSWHCSRRGISSSQITCPVTHGSIGALHSFQQGFI